MKKTIKLLGEACSDAQWLTRMVENLLSVTRIDSEKVTVQKTPTVLDELLDTVLVKFRKRYPEIPVELETPDAFIVIPMDSMLIQQVLMNLLENAALHAEGMTKLTLKVFTVGNRAVFEVTDNGCGIPRERLKTLFSGTDPDVPADSRKHGMGIGLSALNGVALGVLVAIILLIFGTFMEGTAIAVLLVPVLLPIAESMGINVIHFGMILCISNVIGTMTPPVAVNIFSAVQVTRSVRELKIGEISKAEIPFFIGYVAVFFLCVFSETFCTFLIR